MTCTVAAIVALLGYMPERGGEPVIIPRSRIAQYSWSYQLKARICARRYGIRWRIAEDR